MIRVQPYPLAESATTLLPEQANPSRSIKRAVLLTRQFFFVLALRGSCQIDLSRVCKPQLARYQAGPLGVVSTARVERAQLHRARSASKKDGLVAPFL